MEIEWSHAHDPGKWLLVVISVALYCTGPVSIFAVVAEPASRSATAPRRYVELREIALLSTLPAVVCSFCSSSPLTIVCRRGGSQLSVLSSPFLRRLASNDLKIREKDCPHDDPSTRASHNPSLYPDLPSFSLARTTDFLLQTSFLRPFLFPSSTLSVRLALAPGSFQLVRLHRNLTF